MKKYIKMMRIDHWVKQLFILPGIAFALLLLSETFLLGRVLIGCLSACLIASANYLINEYLDANTDQYHPTKKMRIAVKEEINKHVIWGLWFFLGTFGIGLAYTISLPFFMTIMVFLCCGILYNVKPFRFKDVPFLDVLFESINNALRLLLGWFLVSSDTLPPSSILVGYWMGGAFLMAVKRYAEYRMIGDSKTAAKYRKSFSFYSEVSLLISSFFYGMASVFFVGIFLIKYRIEFLLFMPFLIGLFCYYLWLAFQPDSVVQKPEKLYKQQFLMVYCLFLVVLFGILICVDIPILSIFTEKDMIQF